MSDPIIIIGAVLSFALILKAFIFQFWWILPPFLIYNQLKFHYVFYMASKWVGAEVREKIVLEIKIPHEILRPTRAMENVFNSIWGTYDPPSDWRSSYFEGKTLLSTSFEIAGIDGVPHFFIRLPKSNRKIVESSIYSQYPEVEITEVPDYTTQVPMDIPNKEWDFWGTDFELVKSDVYPIKTYEQFFEETPDSSKEEKRIDPLSSLFESISRITKGEQMWIQITMTPITVKEDNFVKRGKAEVDKLVNRTTKSSGFPPLIQDFFRLLIHGTTSDASVEEKESFLPPEMKLTQGEREVVSAIEKKVSKVCFKGYIRYIYLAKRDVFFGGAKGFGVGFFSQFATQNLNNLKPWSETTTKIQAPDIFTARRLYVRKKDMIDKYRRRDPAFDPFSPPEATYVLNCEELATLFHFPGKEAVPTKALERVEMKKGAPPSTLPVEN
jgi:hypothetical protein